MSSIHLYKVQRDICKIQKVVCKMQNTNANSKIGKKGKLINKEARNIAKGTTDSRHWVLWVNQHLLSILTNPTSQVSQQGVTEARQWSDLGSIKCKMQNKNASEYGKIGRGRSWLGYYLLHISSRSRREISASKSTWIKLPLKENHLTRDCLLGC